MRASCPPGHCIWEEGLQLEASLSCSEASFWKIRVTRTESWVKLWRKEFSSYRLCIHSTWQVWVKEKSEFVVVSVVMGVFLWPCASLHCTTSPGCSFCVGESVAIPLKTRMPLDVFSYFSGITECRATLYWLVPTTVIQGLLLHAQSPAQRRCWLLYGAELNFKLNLGDSHTQTNSLDRYKRAFFFVLVTRTISSDMLLLRYSESNGPSILKCSCIFLCGLKHGHSSLEILPHLTACEAWKELMAWYTTKPKIEFLPLIVVADE